MKDIDGAALLAEAEAGARRHAGKNVVVKYGGAAMSDEARKRAVMRDVALLSRCGVKLTLVHGGGPEIDALLRKLGKESVFVDGLRRTDAETMDVVCMVLAGRVNKTLVGLLHAAGGKAVGLCGADGAMLRVEKRCAPLVPGACERADLGFVGEIRQADAAPLEAVLSGGFTPVVATIGVDDDGALFNINADTAAAAVACALRAELLVSMTDVSGVLMDADGGGTPIETLRAREARDLIARGVVRGGMIPKIECCAAAVEGGVREARIVDGRVPHALLRAMSQEERFGTRFVK
jgi:acetylglutamate kinase